MVKINKTFIAILTAVAVVSLFVATPALAQSCGQQTNGDAIETAVLECDGDGEEALWGLLRQIIRIMTGGIGILAVGAVVTGGILYAMSGSSPERIKQAKTIWLNTVIGLAIFAFFASVINFVIPGGIFG